MLTEDQYWEAIQNKVCVKCLEGDGTGACLIARDRACAVKKYFPVLLDVIQSTFSTSIEPYEAQLRNKICGHCVHQSPDGVCSLRNEVECALDRYFPWIVQVIEELQVRERAT